MFAVSILLSIEFKFFKFGRSGVGGDLYYGYE